MQLCEFDREPFAYIPYLDAGRRPGAHTDELLPVFLIHCDVLPDTLDALLITADLQGRVSVAAHPLKADPRRESLPLLGEVLPEKLEPILDQLHAETGALVRDPQRMGVLLAGDFYTVPDLGRRGGTGDVLPVWQALADNYRWVVGVAGNHDLYGDATRPAHLAANAHWLNGDRTEIDQVKIAGIGGIIGNPKRPQRYEQPEYVQTLIEVLEQPSDILLMHDGPDAACHGASLTGQQCIREVIELAAPRLIIRGHSHWNHRLVELPSADAATPSQILNAHEAVFVAIRK